MSTNVLLDRLSSSENPAPRNGRPHGRPAASPPAPSSSWPDPAALPDGIPPVQPFDFGLLPPALAPWVQDIADRTQCPPDYPAVGAIVGLAAIVGRKIGIRPKQFDDWTVVPNLWGAVVGRPGLLKTPALEEVLRPLRELDANAREQFDQAVRVSQAKKMVAAQTRKVIEEAIRKVLRRKEDPTAVATEFLDAEEPEPVRRRYVLNDSTVQKLGEVLRDNPNGVLVYRDELIGLLRSLDCEGQEGARAFYLEAWNGTGRYTYDRVERGTVEIEAAIVSVLGSIQPGPLNDYLSAAVSNGRGDDGLLQRFQLLVWPDVPRRWRNVDRWPDIEARRRAVEVAMRLDTLDPMQAGCDHDPHGGIPFLRLDNAAQVLFNQWREQLERRLCRGEEHPALEAHLAKYRSLVPSLALIFHLVEHEGRQVGPDSLDRAIQWATYLESHARRLYSTAISPEVNSARVLADHLLAGDLADGFALRDVYRPCWTSLATRDDAQRAVDLLCDLDWLRPTLQETPGRKKLCYRINPKIHPALTDRTDKGPPDMPSVSSVSAAEGAPDSSGDSEEIGLWNL